MGAFERIVLVCCSERVACSGANENPARSTKKGSVANPRVKSRRDTLQRRGVASCHSPREQLTTFPVHPEMRYSSEPKDATDKHKYTKSNDEIYIRFASAYDYALKHWFSSFFRSWLSSAIPYLRGRRVLEVACGTGWLLTQYAQRYTTYAVDYNRSMVDIALKNTGEAGLNVKIVQASVECLPFQSRFFDTVLVTMAFTGFPDSHGAMVEIHRVLKPRGRVVIVDINYPSDRNCLGNTLSACWKFGGDIIRDMSKLFEVHGFIDTIDREVGGCGSVHLYVATKNK